MNRLLTIRVSHYNEKARWALDWKGAAHERQSLLPGPHMRTVKKLTNGATVQVPVLVEAQQVIAGSAAIIEHLDEIAQAAEATSSRSSSTISTSLRRPTT